MTAETQGQTLGQTQTQTRTQAAPDIQRLCLIGGVSRAGYYRHFELSAPLRADTELRDVIQKLAIKHRHYGYRRIAAHPRTVIRGAARRHASQRQARAAADA